MISESAAFDQLSPLNSQLNDETCLNSEVSRIVKVYEDWIAVQPVRELFPWPQTEEEVAAYVEQIRSEVPPNRLVMEHARGNYLDISAKAPDGQ